MAPAASSDGAAPHLGPPSRDDHVSDPISVNRRARPRPLTVDIRNALDAVLESEADFTVSALDAHPPLKLSSASGPATSFGDYHPPSSQPEPRNIPANDRLEEISTAFNVDPAHSMPFRVLGEIRNPSERRTMNNPSTLVDDTGAVDTPRTVHSSLRGSASSVGFYDSNNASCASFAPAMTSAGQRSLINSIGPPDEPASRKQLSTLATPYPSITVAPTDSAMEELVSGSCPGSGVHSFATASDTQIDALSAKMKPDLPRLSVINDLAEAPAALGEVSPGLTHWQQVKNHILMAPTPLSERPTQQLPSVSASQPKGKLAFVTKVAGRAADRLGLRSAVESVMGLNHTPAESMSWDTIGIALSDQEREEAARQRRRFARDIRVRLDACSYEESRRRLRRMAIKINPSTPGPTLNSTSKAQSMHQFRTAAVTTQRTDIENEVSAFAPFLMELHRHLPDARAKRVWSRSCPHHSAILAELGVTFIPDASSTDGERAQALEVFGTVVRNWATDSADEELSRWLWLCRALVIDDRALRDRGLPLLTQLLHANPVLPKASYAPSTAFDFESITIALLALLRSLETTPVLVTEHVIMVSGLLADIAAGKIMHVSVESLIDLIKDLELVENSAGIEHEMLWLAVGRAINTELELGGWLLCDRGAVLEVSTPLSPAS